MAWINALLLNTSLLAWVVQGLLVGLLAVAAWHDCRWMRIPNWLVLMGMVLGLVANGLLVPGSGFDSAVLPGGLGWLAALQGLVLGMVVLLPLYWLRAMGAGDVKLMGMVGAFIGPASLLGMTLCVLLAGGLISLLLALRTGKLGLLVQNVRQIFLGNLIKVGAGLAPTLGDLPVSVGKLPYGVAIAIGTIGWMAWRHMTG